MIFKKIFTKLKSIESIQSLIYNKLIEQSNYKRTISDLTDTTKIQEQTIKALMNSVYENDTSLQFVLIKPYRGKAQIYKDGKKLDTDSMTGFSIDWSFDGSPEITIRNEKYLK